MTTWLLRDQLTQFEWISSSLSNMCRRRRRTGISLAHHFHVRSRVACVRRKSECAGIMSLGMERAKHKGDLDIVNGGGIERIRAFFFCVLHILDYIV